MDPIAPLPDPLTEPLPIFSVWPIAWWQAALIALAAWWLWRKLRKQPPAPAPVAAPLPSRAPAAPVPAPGSKLSNEIHTLEKQYLASQDYREGCHALASVLRTHLERESGQEVEALTSEELAVALHDPRAGRFFVELRDAQFGREVPLRETFRLLCRDARHLFAQGRRIELRRPS